MASIAERRSVGVYSRRHEISSMAFCSALRKTLLKGCGLIWGNLCSI